MTMVARLEWMDSYPQAPSGKEALARVLTDMCFDVRHGMKVVADVQDSFEKCPSPKDLRAYIQSQGGSNNRKPRCSQCGGDGWLPVWQLISYGDFMNKTVQELSKSQYDDLSSKVTDTDRPGGQKVISAVRPCSCRVSE
jgi:hypothetical protein